jgi:N-acetylglucosamine-6-phosphate deacetylase
MLTAYVHGRILTLDGILSGRALLSEKGRISALVAADSVPANAKLVDLNGGTLVPGFIDVQVNGGGGVLFNDTPTVEGLAAIARAHARFGTTALMPTVISTDLDGIANCIAAVDAAIVSGVPGIVGIHIEGPYLSPKRRGIHNPTEFPKFDAAALKVLSSLQHGKTMVTLAPDVTTPNDVRALVAAGVIVCIGHSDASYDQAKAALKAGARGFTHLYNAMSPLNHRAPGVVGAALDDQESWCGIIGDGHHVAPAALRIAYTARGADKLMLVTDAMPPLGGDPTFVLQGRTIHTENGCCYGPDGTLAGGAIGFDTIVKNAVEFLGIDLPTASKLASANAAAFLGLEKEIGVITPGARADFVLLDEHLDLIRTFIANTPVLP